MACAARPRSRAPDEMAQNGKTAHRISGPMRALMHSARCDVTTPKTICLITLLSLALGGCTRFDVRAKQDPNADLSRLQTYAWLPPNEAEPADQRVNDRGIDARIRAATGQELQAKGYRPVEAEPDFLLNYRLSSSPSDAIGAGRRGYRGHGEGIWGGWVGIDTVYDTHDVGTLYLAVIDARTRRMVWVGLAQARLLPHVSYEKRVERVDAAVQKILAGFPKR